MVDQVDKILYAIGSGINKVYASDPVKPWCQHHYFKLIEGRCVGCEARTQLLKLCNEYAACELEKLPTIKMRFEPDYLADEVQARIKQLRSTSNE